MSTLERIEWINYWAEDCDKTDKGRVLIIGDSISVGYRGHLKGKIADKYYMTGYGTTKAVDNKYFCSELLGSTMPEYLNYPIVHFNNGLHGFHVSAKDYEIGYRTIIELLIKEFPKSRIILALTTPYMQGGNLTEYAERNKTVLERNEIVRRLAKEYCLEVNDLYSLVDGHSEYWSKDGVHYNEDGYEVLAEHIAAVILRGEKNV